MMIDNPVTVNADDLRIILSYLPEITGTAYMDAQLRLEEAVNPPPRAEPPFGTALLGNDGSVWLHDRFLGSWYKTGDSTDYSWEEALDGGADPEMELVKKANS